MNNKTNATDFSADSEKTAPTTLIENNFVWNLNGKKGDNI